ncbi:barstar family protein [Streptomyces sp. NPDC004539]|uniref:barstar family protein n=1 Tax=Streptomyces sp. NPDC004539 TaxID=3154280 RepID=UPI0033B646D3
MHWLRLTDEKTPSEADRALIAGGRCRTEGELFSEWAQALGFPAYFGRNWNAFYDCLSEISLSYCDIDGPPPAQPLAILVEDAFLLLADADPRALESLLRAVADAAKVADDDEDASLYRDGFRLRLILHDTPDRLLVLTRRIQTAQSRAAKDTVGEFGGGRQIALRRRDDGGNGVGARA